MSFDPLLIKRHVEPEFDREYYLSQRPVDPVAHYIDHGWKQGLDPTRWFSTCGYLARYQDVRAAKGGGQRPVTN
jgi:hypothetical protein